MSEELEEKEEYSSAILREWVELGKITEDDLARMEKAIDRGLWRQAMICV